MLIKDWFAVPAGKIYPEMYPKGMVLRGELRERAEALGLIEDGAAAAKAEAERVAAEEAAKAKKGRA